MTISPEEYRFARLRGAAILYVIVAIRAQGGRVPRGMLACALRLWHHGPLNADQAERFENWLAALHAFFPSMRGANLVIGAFLWQDWLTTTDLDFTRALFDLAKALFRLSSSSSLSPISSTMLIAQLNLELVGFDFYYSAGTPPDWRPAQQLPEDFYAT